MNEKTDGRVYFDRSGDSPRSPYFGGRADYRYFSEEDDGIEIDTDEESENGQD